MVAAESSSVGDPTGPDEGHGTEPIPFARPDVGEAEAAAVSEAILSGWITTGRITAEFERAFAERVGAAHAVSVNSATAGLHLALEAAGIGPGDEVIVPTWTFTASAEVVRYLGADPVLVDVTPDALALDLARAEERITERTRGVIPVHFAGLPMDPHAIAEFAAAHDLAVVEDAAHSFPASHSGHPVGSGPSAATVFSFYATKTLTTGEGGMITTDDGDLAHRVRVMRLHGIDRDVLDRYTRVGAPWQYDVVAPGFKYNLTDVASAMGIVQLERAESMRQRRSEIAARYDAAFADLPLQLPAHPGPGVEHSWHLYSVRLDGAGLDRNDFLQRMQEQGVACSVHFIPLHLLSYWRDRYSLRAEDFPVATESFERVLSLPISSALTDDQVDRVIAAVRRTLRVSRTC